ncbi:nucleotidyltransferase family protein [Desulfomonile tiedjei]|uniref:nucleotidyltransferase family protein n=1 Tax=Desulfomonile tiedjei TaxID=2358 RepID=UPI0012FC3EF8|nr:nucleotidyltransferase family protein [Desulfomonile tiedjei]
MKIVGIILAAGLSNRFGSSKLSQQVSGLPIVSHVLIAALKSELDRVVLVVNPATRDIAVPQEFLSTEKLIKVENRQPQLGMSSSMKTGLVHVTKETTAALILLGDQPGITCSAIDRMIGASRLHKEKIVIPTIDGRRTTPVLFPARLFPELLSVSGDVGGREVIMRYPEMTIQVELADVYDDSDVDTPEDLEKMRRAALERIG